MRNNYQQSTTVPRAVRLPVATVAFAVALGLLFVQHTGTASAHLQVPITKEGQQRRTEAAVYEPLTMQNFVNPGIRRLSIDFVSPTTSEPSPHHQPGVPGTATLPIHLVSNVVLPAQGPTLSPFIVGSCGHGGHACSPSTSCVEQCIHPAPAPFFNAMDHGYSGGVGAALNQQQLTSTGPPEMGLCAIELELPQPATSSKGSVANRRHRASWVLPNPRLLTGMRDGPGGNVMGHAIRGVGHLSIRIPSDVDIIYVACRMYNRTYSVKLEEIAKGSQQKSSDRTPTEWANHHTQNRHPDVWKSTTSDSSEAPFSSSRKANMKPQGATTSNFDVQEVNVVGPDNYTANVVFISEAYMDVDKAAFENRVKTLWTLMNGMDADYSDTTTFPSDQLGDIKNMHQTVPWSRYTALWNVYSVFQASPSRDIPTGSSGGNTNLKCYRPTSLERGIYCDNGLAQAQAAVAPPDTLGNPDRTIIVVIANTNAYGGTGLFHLGVIHVGAFYNGFDLLTDGSTQFTPRKYLSLVSHEVGHAMGRLSDEYSFGFDEPQNIEVANCEAPTSGGIPNPISWQNWIDIFANPTEKAKYVGSVTNPNFGVATTPVQVCGYDNYYKPNENCMMNRLNDYFMCPVCREAATFQVMKLTNFAYQWPRFPLEDQVLVIPRTLTNSSSSIITVSSGVVLHLPQYLTPSNSYNVTWINANDHTVIAPLASSECPQCIMVPSATLSAMPDNGQLTIVATIQDNTNFLSPGKRAEIPSQLLQSATFRIVVVANQSAAASRANTTLYPPVYTRKNAFGVHELDGYSAYMACNVLKPSARPVCNLTGTIKVYQSPVEDNLLAGYDTWVLYVVGALAVTFVLLWIFAALRFTKHGKRVVRPIFRTEFKGVVKVIRWVMRGSSVLFMVASIAVMGIAIYYYINASAIGKIIIVVGIVLAVGLYIMAFVGFWAVAHRAKKLVILNTIVLTFGLLVLGTLCGLVITIGRDIQTDDGFWTRQLRTLWQSLVADSPDNACAIEGMLSCSGFYIPCNNVVGSTLYCPTNCETINQRYGFPCKERLQQYISDGYGYVLGVIIGSMALMVFAIFFNCVYHWKLVQMKRSIRDRTNTIVYNRANSMHIDTKNVERTKALHILKTLDNKDIPKLVKEFHRMDMDGDGELNRVEMTHFFRKALCHHAAPEEIDALFEVADLDGNGSISLEEFLIIFNKKKPKKEVGQYSWERDGTVPGLAKMKRGVGKAITSANLPSPPSFLRRKSDWREDPVLSPTNDHGDGEGESPIELKTEEQLEKEVLLRERAKEHLSRCGLYDRDDEVAEQEARTALELTRRRSSANFAGISLAPNDIDVPHHSRPKHKNDTTDDGMDKKKKQLLGSLPKKKKGEGNVDQRGETVTASSLNDNKNQARTKNLKRRSTPDVLFLEVDNHSNNNDSFIASGAKNGRFDSFASEAGTPSATRSREKSTDVEGMSVETLDLTEPTKKGSFTNDVRRKSDGAAFTDI